MALYRAPIPSPSGPVSEPRMQSVLVHGFAQNGRCWGAVGDGLAAYGPVVAVDLPGHGRSTHAEADLPAAGELVNDAVRQSRAARDPAIDGWDAAENAPPEACPDAATGPPVVLVGYSLGGRVALHAALGGADRPRDQQYGADDNRSASLPFDGLVLIGATAGIADAVDRTARIEIDEQRASRLEDIGLDAFLDEWLQLPLFASLSEEAGFLAERRQNSVEGLASSLRNCGTGRQVPLHDRLREIRVPVLCLAGERDRKFRAEAEIIASAVDGPSTVATVPGAGHACHLEDPEFVVRAIEQWATTTWP